MDARLSALLTLVAVTLAGCSSDDPSSTTTPLGATTDAPASVTSADEVGQSDPQIGPTNDGENSAPAGSFMASTKAGPIPLNVSFTFEGYDADRDALTFALDADGDGEPDSEGSLEGEASATATVNFTYEAAGAFVARLVVSDGDLDAVFVLNITAEPAIVVDAPAPIEITGHIVAPDAFAQGGVCMLAIFTMAGVPDDTVGNVHPVPAGVEGWAYAFTAPGYWTMWLEGSAAILAQGESGNVPDTATDVYVCGKDATTANTDYVLVLTPA